MRSSGKIVACYYKTTVFQKGCIIVTLLEAVIQLVPLLLLLSFSPTLFLSTKSQPTVIP